ncbi:sensor histidine kinase [Streptomyces sp. NPDC049040]|uniref:sensor histidine kinase n=1 Tax=Streptomyces sp. NPDC049040 TaxID=3365593 RepID=UPI00371838A8
MRNKSLRGVGRDPRASPGGGVDAAFQVLVPEVLEAFRHRLVESGNPLGTDRDCWRVCKGLAATTLTACAHALGHAVESPPPDPGADRTPGRLHAVLLARDIPPRASVQAWLLLFRVAVDRLGALFGDPDGALLLALHDAVGSRLAEDVRGYDMALLDAVRDAEERSRRALARDVHDRIGSAASLALRQLELFELEHGLSADTDPRLRSLQDAVVGTVHTARDIVGELRTETCTSTLSLRLALTGFAEAMGVEGTAVEIDVPDAGGRLPPGVGDDLFVMLRECIRNALAHADATRVTVTLRLERGEAHAGVRDNGSGFAPGARRGAGLASLAERVELLGGRLAVAGVPGRGTAIELSIPIEEDERADQGGQAVRHG